jgi:hypothetical protein
MAKMKAGPYVSTARAKKTPGKSVKVGGTVVIKDKGKKPMGFKKGGLHQSLNVPQDQPIPAGKKAAALAGKYGPLAKKQAVYAFRGALATGRQTAKDNQRRANEANKEASIKRMKVYTNRSN